MVLLVLAAGMGSRYGGIKQLDRFGPSGETIMDYSVYDAMRSGFSQVVFVIRKDFEDSFRKTFVSKWDGKVEIGLAFQAIDDVPHGISYDLERTKPWGTAHAMLSARDIIKQPFAVINADDFYGKEAFQAMAAFLSDKHHGQTGKYAMCGYRLDNTLSEHGSVSRGICSTDNKGMLLSVEEHTRIYKDKNGEIISEQEDGMHRLSANDVVSMNFWGFTPEIFGHATEIFKSFLQTSGFEPKSELYIPAVIDNMIRSGDATVEVLRSDARWFGVTYAHDKAATTERIKALVEEKQYPENLWTGV